MAVPNYFTSREKQSYLDAADIAGISCLRLINDSTATALTYGYFRRTEFTAARPRLVCFIDLGHSYTSVTFVQFFPEQAKIVYTASNRNLGARDFDYMLFHLYGEEFKNKYKCDPRQNAKCRLRMFENIEKARKLLTANKVADLNMEALMEDQDLCKSVKRGDFE